ncbi:MAG: DNA topoisomerase (ATP-hydrolyzing) subunit B [Clostridiales bacterium]|jgi:DNA gyrase subunit B|nr:DNA topoisomerase (ATP-hydrolyzing) subunit B [Clostridiales bacterium]
MSEGYDGNQIQILEGLEAVRKTPGMYIGTTSSKGLHHLVYEIVDNAVDEALMGYCTEITVNIHEDNSISVSDNGRGIPVGIQPQKGVSALEVVFTVLHAGGKFGGGGYKVSGGLHGVGASVVNALSEWLRVSVYMEGKEYVQSYLRGAPEKPVEIAGETDKRGTFIHFKPDADIFEEMEYSFDVLKQRLQETAFLTKGLKITLNDLRGEEIVTRTYRYEGGIKEFVRHINKNRSPVFDKIFYCEQTHEGVFVEAALQYNDGYLENTYTFVNNINTMDGGTHVAGFRAAMTKTVNDYARKFNLLKEADKNLSGDDVREGLTAVVSIKLEHPQFDSQTKTKLGNSEARLAVEAVVSQYFSYFLEENPSIGKLIVDKSLMASRARDAAKKARELVRRKSVLENGSLPGKLTDCSEKDPTKCEIYIVEGDSAGGSAKSARTPKTQAILPLRGKIMNVEKARLDKILSNEEIKAMITAFGTGIHEDFDIGKLRYHKIVIMTDADVDGAHIRTLLLTFMFRFMTPLIEEGKVYIAQPPLYKVEKGKNEYYAYSDLELEGILKEIGREGIKPIQRYKGLGEMDAGQLWDTTMDPERRTLLKVNIDDAIAADQIFTQLMGDKVEPRREFIHEYGKMAQNLDV